MTTGAPRALVTRPAEEAGPLADRLRACGIDAVVEPLLEIFPAGRGVPALERAQAVLVTSRNGVQALAAATPVRDSPLLAVGDATARAARAAGFRCVVSAGGSSADLARLACARLRPGAGPLIHACGVDTAGDLAGRLSAQGFTVDRAVLYKAAPVTRLSASASELISEGGLAMALFFSPRTSSVFAGLVGGTALEACCQRIDGIFISAAAAAAARPLRWRSEIRAARPDMASLIAAAARSAWRPASR